MELESKPLILVVDDEPRFRFALQTCLESEFEVETAKDGEEALAFVQGRIPQLIILDLSMPKMGGKEFTEKLTELYGKARPPIIVLTAHAEPERVTAMAALGVQSYFLKPVKIEELEKKIHDLLDPNHSQAALARLRLAESWAANEAPASSAAKIAELLELDPLNGELRMLAARVAICLGDLTGAKYHAQVAAAATEDAPPGADLLLAFCALGLGQLDSARFHAERADATLRGSKKAAA